MSILRGQFLNICTIFKQRLPSQPCLLCGAANPQAWCSACDATLPRLNTSLCPVCALPTLNADICGNCLQHPPHFKYTVAAYAYAFPLNKLILALKYGQKFHLSNLLADRLVQQIKVLPDCIIPMPLHPQRLRERGFNQSLLLAQRVAQKLKLPVLPATCQRIRNTPSQSTLPWNQRGRNMHNAFSCNGDVAGKRIAVVDDVMTTGATLNELALSILNAGASEVSAWVVARTLPHSGQ